MRDFFVDIRQDIKKIIKYYQHEIAVVFREDVDGSINDKSIMVDSEVQEENKEEEEKVIRFKKFISHHREGATKAGTALYDILSHLFDAFFFVVIKRKTAFEDRHNLQKFGMNEEEVSQIQSIIHPASLSSIGTKGIPAYLLLGLQKAVSRLAVGESMVFHKKSAEFDDIDRNEEQWKQVMKKSGGSNTIGSNFQYESDGMRIKSHWGNESVINNILTIFSEEFNTDDDEIFFLGVDVTTEEIVSYANFNDFVMMPILQHFINQFAQANSSTISQVASINLLNR